MCSFAISRLRYGQPGFANPKPQYQPPLHVTLDIQQILEIDTPWRTWCCFEHEATELRMEHRRCLAFPTAMTLALHFTATALMASIPLLASSKIWYAATLLEELGIVGQSLKDVGLPQ